MTRTRCPSCICGFDGSTEREGVPSTQTIQNMLLVRFLDCLDNLGITHSSLDGTQAIILGGNLRDICQQKRAACIGKLAKHRIAIARILSEQLTEEIGC